MMGEARIAALKKWITTTGTTGSANAAPRLIAPEQGGISMLRSLLVLFQNFQIHCVEVVLPPLPPF
jgi:hypothetical protein